jgi:hypothetical protein
MAMDSSTVTLSSNVVVWVGSLLIAMLGSIGTFCAHTLINMNRTLNEMSSAGSVNQVKVNSRLEVLERHDARNEAESSALLEFLKTKEA